MTLGHPLKIIVLDYFEVLKEISLNMKKSPVKSLVWCVFGGTITAFYKKCPDLCSYTSEIIEYSNEIGLCAETTRNSQSKRYIDNISTLLNDGCIHYANFGIFSLIIHKSRSSNCFNYHQTCKHLQPRKWMFHESIVDVGVWNQWLILNRTMIDFDVNENEFV